VGRINEALKRTETGGGPQSVASRGQIFKPAWSVTDTDDDDGSEPRPETTSILTPSVASADPNRGLVRFSSQWRERLAGGPDGDVGLTEQFRRLAATLHHAHQTNGLRDVMLTSASPGDGKTLTAVNLAMVLAESYRYKVLLIDADLRRPSIPNVGDLTDGSGLSEALIAPTEQKLALVQITSRLTLLQILEEAASRFDWVILDAPPIGPATDARLLAQMVGGTLFVIYAGQTQCPDVQKAIDAIGREQILGVVLNGVEDAGPEPYYYGTVSP
jgi:Mrp family chromosome partitioning ATPase